MKPFFCIFIKVVLLRRENMEKPSKSLSSNDFVVNALPKPMIGSERNSTQRFQCDLNH